MLNGGVNAEVEAAIAYRDLLVENEALKARIHNLENGYAIPKKVRDTVRELMAKGELAP